MARSLILALLGVAGFALSAYSLQTTLKTGTAHLRGGRRITRTHNPSLFWTNVIGLCVALVMSLGLLYVGLLKSL